MGLTAAAAEAGGILAVLTILVLAGCTGAALPTGQQAAGEPASSSVEMGREIYQANCAGCHGGATGGRMQDVPPPLNANGHAWHHPDCVLTQIIEQGSAAFAGAPSKQPQMPAFASQFSQSEIAAVLAYVKTWWTPEQRELQAQATANNC